MSLEKEEGGEKNVELESILDLGFHLCLQPQGGINFASFPLHLVDLGFCYFKSLFGPKMAILEHGMFLTH